MYSPICFGSRWFTDSNTIIIDTFICFGAFRGALATHFIAFIAFMARIANDFARGCGNAKGSHKNGNERSHPVHLC
jgi:hypothetical protein